MKTRFVRELVWDSIVMGIGFGLIAILKPASPESAVFGLLIGVIIAIEWERAKLAEQMHTGLLEIKEMLR